MERIQSSLYIYTCKCILYRYVYVHGLYIRRLGVHIKSVCSDKDGYKMYVHPHTQWIVHTFTHRSDAVQRQQQFGHIHILHQECVYGKPWCTCTQTYLAKHSPFTRTITPSFPCAVGVSGCDDMELPWGRECTSLHFSPSTPTRYYKPQTLCYRQLLLSVEASL